jgi:hypothetical protein
MVSVKCSVRTCGNIAVGVAGQGYSRGLWSVFKLYCEEHLNEENVGLYPP